MPLPSHASYVRAIQSALVGKHLPGCYTRSIPLQKCTCGGPERHLLIEALAEQQMQAMALAPDQASVLCE